jgi:hypothetical protein
VTTQLPVVTDGLRVGPQDPSIGAPARAPGSVRRTSSVDVARPDGPGGPLEIDARARDLTTAASSHDADLVVEQRLAATLDPFQELVTVAADPAAPLDALLGSRVGPGFRAKAAAAVPGHRRDATRLYLLLDDLPAATLVSGYSLQRAGAIGLAEPDVFAPNRDLCSGWAADATVFQTIEAAHTVPMTIGPAAPSLARAGDPDAWHALPDPAPGTVRRRRRIDVVPDGTGALAVDAMFRDSYFAPDGAQSVVHEYGIVATIDAATLTVTTATAAPRVLPYIECPAAAASAGRIAGLRLDELRDRVRAEWVGTSTCTHLNDLLRSLEDVRALVPASPGNR